MKKTYTLFNKVSFTIIGLIVITFFVKYAMEEVDRFRKKRDGDLEKKYKEGFEVRLPSRDDLKKGAQTLVDGGKKVVNTVQEKVLTPAEKLAKEKADEAARIAKAAADEAARIAKAAAEEAERIAKENADPILGPVKRFVEKGLNTVGNGVLSPFNGIIDFVETGLNGFIKILNFMEHIIEDMGTFFTNLNNLGKGVSSHIKCGAQEYKDGWNNTGPITLILMQCSWEKFVNFFNGQCTRYYIFDIFIGILHGIFIELPFAIIYGITGFDMHFFTDMFYELILVPLDELCYTFSGYHFLQWSDPVIEKCYRCKGSIKSNTGQYLTYVKSFDWWVKAMKCGIDEMNDGLYKIFWSILPNPKWGAWAQGNTYDRDGYSGGRRNGVDILDGGNNDPDPLGPYIPMVNPNRRYQNEIPNVDIPRLKFKPIRL
jgi:hypothetical protein